MNGMITIPHDESTFPAYYTFLQDGKKHPGLIVIHEVWGLNNHTKEIADRFASRGYNVIAPDLISHTGITEQVDQTIIQEVANPETRDEAQKKLRAAMAPVQSPEFAKQTLEKLQSCLSYLLGDEKVTGQVAVVGFCFGGTYAFSLAAMDTRVQAVVPFYGHAMENELEKIACPVLAFYGEQDERLMGELPAVKKEMEKHEKKFEAIVYPDTGHAFFNDTNPAMYNKEAAKDAWEKTLEFLQSNLT